jgi:DNA-binding transcriptional regulator YiaG
MTHDTTTTHSAHQQDRSDKPPSHVNLTSALSIPPPQPLELQSQSVVHMPPSGTIAVAFATDCRPNFENWFKEPERRHIENMIRTYIDQAAVQEHSLEGVPRKCLTLYQHTFHLFDLRGDTRYILVVEITKNGDPKNDDPNGGNSMKWVKTLIRFALAVKAGLESSGNTKGEMYSKLIELDAKLASIRPFAIASFEPLTLLISVTAPHSRSEPIFFPDQSALDSETVCNDLSGKINDSLSWFTDPHAPIALGDQHELIAVSDHESHMVSDKHRVLNLQGRSSRAQKLHGHIYRTRHVKKLVLLPHDGRNRLVLLPHDGGDRLRRLNAIAPSLAMGEHMTHLFVTNTVELATSKKVTFASNTSHRKDESLPAHDKCQGTLSANSASAIRARAQPYDCLSEATIDEKLTAGGTTRKGRGKTTPKSNNSPNSDPHLGKDFEMEMSGAAPYGLLSAASAASSNHSNDQPNDPLPDLEPRSSDRGRPDSHVEDLSIDDCVSSVTTGLTAISVRDSLEQAVFRVGGRGSIQATLPGAATVKATPAMDSASAQQIEVSPTMQLEHPASTRMIAAPEVSRTVNIRATRDRLGMTQEEFATAFGLSISSLRNWEQGTRTPERPIALYLRLIDRFPKEVMEEVIEARGCARI